MVLSVKLLRLHHKAYTLVELCDSNLHSNAFFIHSSSGYESWGPFRDGYTLEALMHTTHRYMFCKLICKGYYIYILLKINAKDVRCYCPLNIIIPASVYLNEKYMVFSSNLRIIVRFFKRLQCSILTLIDIYNSYTYICVSRNRV